MAKNVGVNALVDVVSKKLKKIKDFKNHQSSAEFKNLNEQLSKHQWKRDEDNYLILDTDEKVRLHQEAIYHSGTTKTKGNTFYPNQPWMQEKGVNLGKVVKGGKRRRVKAKRAFDKIEDPSEVGYNDDLLYKATQDAQAEDRAYSLAEGTTGYKEVKAELLRLDPDGSLGFNTPKMFIELKNENKRTVKDRLALIAELNKDLKNYQGITNKNELYSAGHASSRAKGGPAVASNYGYPETKAENFASQNKKDLPKKDLEEIGVDTSWGMWVRRYLSTVHGAGFIKQTEAQRLLTEQDKLDILSRKIDWKTALSARINDLHSIY